MKSGFGENDIAAVSSKPKRILLLKRKGLSSTLGGHTLTVLLQPVLWLRLELFQKLVVLIGNLLTNICKHIENISTPPPKFDCCLLLLKHLNVK